MTRILTYNILVGGARRIDQITEMIRAAQPDVVGLVEAIDPRVVEELGERLEMEYRMSGDAQHESDYAIALLSRLPIVSSQVHRRPGIINKPVLEVCVQEEDGRELTIFVTHLPASFANGGRGGDGIRREEARQTLHLMEARRGTPHLLMGDFNSIAPGDELKGSRLLRYLIDLGVQYRRNPQNRMAVGHPFLNFIVPPHLRFLNPILLQIPRSRLLSAIFDGALFFYTDRGTIRLLRKAGYVDSFRRASPHAMGFTCPAGMPAGRIDYIMVSPELAERLSACHVLAEGNDVYGYEASDHLPVMAEFGEAVGNPGVSSSSW